MAYRRRQGINRASTFKEEIHYSPNDPIFSSSSSSSSSLAAQAIRASAAHREASMSPAYSDSYTYRDRSQAPTHYEYTSLRSPDDSKYGFWSVLAEKAKAILDDDEPLETSKRTRPQMLETSATMPHKTYQSPENYRGMDNPKLRKGLDAIRNAFEEGRTIVENKTADIIQETRKLQIKRKGSNSDMQNQYFGADSSLQQPTMQPAQPQKQTNPDTQLKASRDVAMATATKAKLLLRELKTVKADLIFAKERCSHLEEENKIIRENRVKGDNPADDDLIRLQLETLLEEKGRLAHENSMLARENRFLREIVEYHQLTMQDVDAVYLDEGSEEDPEAVSPISRMLSVSPPSSTSPGSPTGFLPSVSASPASKEYLTLHTLLEDMAEDDDPGSVEPPCSGIPIPPEAEQ